MRPPWIPLVAAAACGSTAEKVPQDAPKRIIDSRTGDAGLDAPIDAPLTANPAVLWLTPRGADEAVVILSPTPPTFEF